MTVLVAGGVVAGLLFLLIARLTSRPERISEARRRVSGLLLEMWLYGDEPAQVLRTQLALLAANLRYLSLLLPTAIACTPPTIALWLLLDPLLGRAPIPPGDCAIITADTREPAAELSAPRGFRVETPPLRLGSGEVCWRVRAEGEAEGDLRLTTRGGVVSQRIVASREPRYLGIRSRIHIRYPERRIAVAGIVWPWEAWMFLVATVTAVTFHRRAGVSF